MRLHRFYINFPLEHTIETVSDENLIHQWRDVFRYNVGSEVILFDGSGQEYDSVIEELGNREAKLRLVSEKKGIVPERKTVLFQSLIKKDKMEWVVEKATELGVSKIIPIISERSEKKCFNPARARKIAIEAAEQCGRADIPVLEDIVNFSAALEQCENPIVFDPTGESLASLPSFSSQPVSIFVGPEGGWTEKELNLFKQKGARIFSLGPLTLRAETSAVCILSRLFWQNSAA